MPCLQALISTARPCVPTAGPADLADGALAHDDDSLSIPEPSTSAETLAERFPELYARLRRLAQARIRVRAGSPTLSATGLVHEVYLKLSAWRSPIVDQRHLLALATRAMRQVIVDHVRLRSAAKRGGGPPALEFSAVHAAADDHADVTLAVHGALGRLARQSPRLALIVEHRFFGGLSEQETACAVGVSLRTVQRDWSRAREWLRGEICA